jgi:nucleoside-diphosphate-sugar epimerase
MHVLIIGGTRFMGPHITKNLHAAGHMVTLFHRGQSKMELPEGVAEITGDRDELMQHARQLRQLQPDVVLDMIASTEKQAQHCVEVFASFTRRIVVASSQDVYQSFGRVNRTEDGAVDLSDINEASPLRKHLYPYRNLLPGEDDYDKILVERVYMSLPELPGTIMRLPAVYGPGDAQHRMFAYLKRMLDGRPHILLEECVARWRWTHGYVENVADAITLAITDERASGRVYNVGEPFALSVAERVEHLARVTQWPGQIVILPGERLPASMRETGNMDQHIVVNSSRLRQELGYSEHLDLRESFRRTVDWESYNLPAQIDPAQFDYPAEDTVVASL